MSIENKKWPDDVRFKMIEKSEFYSDPRVYQFGFYDGYQLAKESETPSTEKDQDYWKKRCEAAEENIKTYSDWNNERLDVDRISSTADVLFLKWKAAFDNWQQLKNQKP
jgi:hypothetical protein